MRAEARRSKLALWLKSSDRFNRYNYCLIKLGFSDDKTIFPAGVHVSSKTSRRHFLKQTALAFTGLATAAAFDADSLLSACGKSGFKISEWTGDDYTVGHKLRDGKLPKFPESTERKVDFVIVGGGIAGLSSAYQLRSHDILLLEQYDEFGGHSRGGTYNGIDYSYGAAYIAIDEGAVGEMLDSLKLDPIKLATSKNAWFANGQWLQGVNGNDRDIVYKELKRLNEENKSFWGTWDGVYSKRLIDSQKLMQMDAQPLVDSLKGYDPAFLGLMDSVLKSGINGGINSLSALAGLSTLEDVFAPTYLLPGGNPTVTRALARQIKEENSKALVSGAFVWSIQLKDNGARVIYGLRDGSMHAVECRHVIIAIPHMVASRVMKGLNDKARATLFRFRYGSYLVANVLLRKRVFEGAYDNFLSSPFQIADITVAETPYMMTGKYKEEMGSVLTVYIPYDAGSPGRTLLFQGDRQKFSASILAELEKIVPGITGSIEEIVLTRWGHSMAVARPNYCKYIAELHGFENDSFTFAHSSAHGLPGIEAAAAGAKSAVERALKTKSTAKIPRLHSIAGTQSRWSAI